MRILTNVISILILAGSVLAATPPDMSEDHLRERIDKFHSAFKRGQFDVVIEMYSSKLRGGSIASPQEREKLKTEWQIFIKQEKPIFTIKSVDIRGPRAIVKVNTSIRLPDASRENGDAYDLWVFEEGDWYFREGSIMSSEHLPKD
jgi:hypothetical protein